MPYITHFTTIMISNENLFNYKVVDLVGPATFIYTIFPYEVIWKFWKFKIQNLNHVFGCQDNLNLKNFQLQSCRSGWDLQLLYRPFFNLRPFEFLKNRVFKYYKSHKGDAPWCCMSHMSSQRWRALMLPVTIVLSMPVTYTNLIGDVL